MAQKRYYTAEEAAELLGISPGDVNQRRERNELHGLRDGATWKFKVEDIERLAAELKEGGGGLSDEGDVLASEVELGPSASSKSGTVLGPGKSPADSDIKLAGSGLRAGSDIKLAGSDIKLGGSDIKLADVNLGGKPAPAADLDELDMTLDEDLKLDDSQIAMTADEEDSSAAVASVKPTKKTGDSDIKLGDAKAASLDDDDVVLGGSTGVGSDVAIGGDSGIKLVDPKDSGLSLEEPLELASSDDDSLELGEDDMLSLAADDADSPTELKPDNEDFLLTPLEEAGDEEDSESGSQVIALDGGPVSDTAATMVGTGPAPMAAMLDEDLGPGVPALGAAPARGGFGAAPLGGITGYEEAGGAPLGGPAAAAQMPMLPEMPYSGWNIVALSFCVILLVLCGWMSYDLMRNMWSWNGPYQASSSLMDWILNMFG